MQAQGNGDCIRCSRIDPHLTLAIEQDKFGIENAVRKAVNEYFLHQYAKRVGERDKQIVRQRAGSNDAFQRYRDRLGLGSSHYNRDAVSTFLFSQYQGISTRLHLTGGKSLNSQLDFLRHNLARCFSLVQR